MTGMYDEDVYRNPYFSRMLMEYPDYLEKAVVSKGIVCVPKYSIASNWSPSQTDIEDHVLLPRDADVNDDDDGFITMSNKIVHIEDGQIITKSGFAVSQQVTVLFSETFHTNSGDNYRVFCIDGLLNTSVDTTSTESSTPHIPPTSYKECLEFLWSHPGGSKTKEYLDKVLHTFSMTYSRLEGETLRSIVDAANSHFTKAMQLLLKDSVMRRSVQQTPYHMDNMKMAVETYVMHSTHQSLFPVITATMAGQDAEINKINRNLIDLRPSELGIRKIFSQNIAPAKKELNSLNLYNSPMGKLLCLKRVVSELTRAPKSAKKHVRDSVAMMSTDDLLPIMIFLIIKSEVPNWMANLVYMQHFHFSKSSDDDEFGFFLASIEAAVEHIKSGNVTNEIKPLKRDRWNSFFKTDDTDGSSMQRHLSSQVSYSVLDEFFRFVQDGNLMKVQEVLTQPHKRYEEVNQKLCHPLCSCDKCDKLLSNFRTDSDLVTVYSRDSHGYTAMHVAAYYGQELLIDLLIQNNAIVDTTDYLELTPLHLACQRGLKNVILGLLQFGADIMATDSEGNTPLHFCCANGHEDCLMTLLTHESGLKKLDINVANEFGDTSLHLAAKWGYESIVQILLENGADATLCNKRKQTPVSLAQNVRVQRWLQVAAEDSDSHTVERQSNGSRKSSSSNQDFTSTDQLETLNQYNLETSSHVQTSSLEAGGKDEGRYEKDKLFNAIIEGDMNQVKFYLGIDCEIDYGEDDDIQMSPSVSLGDMCHPLCLCDKCQIIQKVIFKTGLNVNSKTASGLYPIHMAVLHNHSPIVSLLILYNADINVQNHQSLTALHLACCLRNSPITDLLVKAGARLNIYDASGNTPLLVAACNGFVDGVQTLIKAGAHLNSTNDKGNTALHEALKRDDSVISTMLMTAGADPRIRNKLGKLPLDETDVPAMQDLLRTTQTKIEDEETNAKNNNIPSKYDMKVSAGGDGEITIQELFAAFEEKDLHRLQTIASSIRSFDRKSRLRSTKTRDMSTPCLNAIE